MLEANSMALQSVATSHEISIAHEVEVIWQMGIASLSSNNNELVLPQYMATSLPTASIEELKLRLSHHIGAATIAFVDHDSMVFRICRVPGRFQAGDSPSSFSSPAPSATSRSSVTPAPEPKGSIKASSKSGKSAVPRPANAFILYRTDRHPVLKQSNPELHNNDISKMVGLEWKNQTEEVLAEYRARAERIKQQHAIDNPGYQYAPRKPGDKRRRLTKKKLARMQSVYAANDVADHVRSEAAAGNSSEFDDDDDQPEFSSPARLPTAEDHLGTRRPHRVSHLAMNGEGGLEITLPSNNNNLSSEVQAHQNPAGSSTTNSLMAIHGPQVHTAVPGYVQNNDAFVNSLIDWEGLADDFRMIHGADVQELVELEGTELGNPFLGLTAQTSNQDSGYNEEINRTMRFF